MYLYFLRVSLSGIFCSLLVSDGFCLSSVYLLIAVAVNTWKRPAHRIQTVDGASAATQHDRRVSMGLLRAAEGHTAAASARVPARWTRLRTPDATAFVPGARKPEPRHNAARVAYGPLRAAFRAAHRAAGRHLRLRTPLGRLSPGERLDERQS